MAYLLDTNVISELRRGRRCDPNVRWLNSITEEYAGRTFPVRTLEADRWGRIPSHGQMPDVDGVIAATALVHGLTVATRNTADFWRSGVPLVNPFEETHG